MSDFDPGKGFHPFGPGGRAFYKEQMRAYRRAQRAGGPRGPHIFLAVFLIVAGTLLFLGNLGLLPIHNFWDLVPIGMIVLGLIRLVHGRPASGRVFGALLLVFGCLFLLVNLGVLHIRAKDPSWPLSILFILFGIVLLIKFVESGGRDHTNPFARWYQQVAGDRLSSLNEAAVFGSVKRQLDTEDFRGGEAKALFGEVKIDLRRARIADQQAPITIEATALFGGIKIRIPDTWRANVTGLGVLGAYEDKTIPPNQGPLAPLLIVTGLAMFGAVEIEN